MPTVSITIEGLDDAVFHFDKLDAKVAEGVREVVRSITDEVLKDSKVLCPVDSGRLEASIEAEVSRDGFSGTVGSGLDYAPSVEFGSKPHVIRPRFGGYMTFKIGGHWVRVTHVNHPGNRPHPFLFPALEMNAEDYRNGLILAINKKAVEASK